ncbi:MAG: mechanosensitive ion channel family protein [Methanomicrobiales archaeon]|nr:mechanosensitive ion channel family protein [Methanomicrobiales archaeon]
MALASEIIAVLIITAGIILAFITHEIYRWLQKRALATESKLDDILLIAFGRPLIILILFFSFYIAIRYYAPLPEGWMWIFDSKGIVAFYIVIGAWVISSFVYNILHVYGSILASRTETEFDDRIISILEVAARYVIWFIAILMILSTLEIDITPLIAGAGIAGLAVALAAQDIISNIFGGAVIVVDRAFKLNDRIKIEEYIGDVISIGPRSTRIRTLDNQMVTIPNSKISSSIVTNYALPEARQKIRIPVSVAYGSDVEKVRSILLEIGREVARESDMVLEDPAPKVYFLEFGQSSLNFTLVVWAKTYALVWEVTDSINTKIDRRFREEGIEIPFPQLDVHMKER